jgi:hypothetical protein
MQPRPGAWASNFLAARIGAFDALCCYAKITPAALHRGEISSRCLDDAEAVGRKPEFDPDGFRRRLAEAAAQAMATLSMAAS